MPKLITVVPATPGQIVQIISVANRNGERPTEGDVVVEAHPVIAWAVYEGNVSLWLEPLMLEGEGADSTMWHVMPDGRLCLPDDQSVETLDQARSETLQRAQEKWDRKQDDLAG
jgi:hypothetical protein